ncbi:MAG TPA: SIMPL domain-containing protein, partial [Anaeromyxobacteraceae bacterium]|nr:SIMPL domain-containing protein [Anaeromyxobacteraceae bacterium]
MTRPLRRHALVLVLALAPLGAPGAAAQERIDPPPSPQYPPYPPQPRTIRVNGEGRASAAPDVALVTIGVEAIGKTLARTRADADARMRQVVATAKSAGIDPKDVQTVRYDVQIERPWKDGQPGPI